MSTTPRTDIASRDTLPSALSATQDGQAVDAWIMAKGSRSIHTLSAYRRESNRLLLWTAEQNCRLADLKVEDVHAFFALLADPPLHWLRPRQMRQGDALLDTQVLVKALNPDSIDYTRTVLGQLFSYLSDAGYLTRNVFRLSAKPATVTSTTPKRLLDVDCWQWLWQWLIDLPETRPDQARAARRWRWVMALLYHTGIRREEAAKGVMGDFTRHGGHWTLSVVGKRLRLRHVSVNSALLDELMRYRRSLQLSTLPVPGETFPLIASLQRSRTGQLSPRSIGLIIHDLALLAAGDCEDAHWRAQITRLSTHWLRHTNATHRLLAGASMRTTQDELGHTDPKTTSLYAHAIDSQKHADAEKLANMGNRDLG